MNIQKTVTCLLLIFSFIAFEQGHATYYVRNGGLINADVAASESVECHFQYGVDAFEKNDWTEATRQFTIVICSYPGSSYAKDSYYYLGVAHFYQQDYEFANTELTNYLKAHSHPSFFEEAIEYKFHIAEAFRCGARRRLFSHRRCPKWATGRTLALCIYDEVIAALPSSELAARALYSKGSLLRAIGEYRESVDAYQTLVRRFPKHELAPESYLAINQVYIEQVEYEWHNPDLLALAQVNVRKFKEEFPKEERIILAEEDILCIKELYAKGLYDTGLFYERVCKPRASVIYYRSAIEQYPETEVAGFCRSRLFYLGYELPGNNQEAENSQEVENIQEAF